MDNLKQEQAITLLRKVLKERSGWHTYTDEEYDLLTQEIELYLLQFKPKDKKNRYRQTDLEEQINDILKKRE
jgi:hypothetical protein